MRNVKYNKIECVGKPKTNIKVSIDKRIGVIKDGCNLRNSKFSK